MPILECGFPQDPVKLVHYGPTLLVHVGFDEHFKPNSGASPNLPSDEILALVDTGATIGCIDTSLAIDLDLPLVGTRDWGG